MIRKVIPKDKNILEKVARKILEPLYGSQDKAINEWILGIKYKNAFLYLSSTGEPIGLLVIKTNFSKPFAKISTLVVFGEKQKGVGKQMLKFAEKFAVDLEFQYIIVTVSENVTESVCFFQKHGFEIVDHVYEKYQKNTIELILKKEI